MAETEVVPEEPQASLKPCKSFLANPEPNSGTSFGMINRLSVDPPPRILKGARTHRAIKIRGMSQPNGCAGRQFEVYIYTRVCVCVCVCVCVHKYKYSYRSANSCSFPRRRRSQSWISNSRRWSSACTASSRSRLFSLASLAFPSGPSLDQSRCPQIQCSSETYGCIEGGGGTGLVPTRDFKVVTLGCLDAGGPSKLKER